MTSIVDVWNLALAMLAQDEEMTDPQDRSTKAGRLCGRFWPQVRDEVLQAGAWACVTKRASLAADGNPVAFQHSGRTRFPLPSDCVRPLALSQDGEATGAPVPFEREGRSLLVAAQAPLFIRYISRDVPVNAWDAELIHAASSLLAKYLAVPLTGKNSERDRMEVEAQKALILAEVRDAKSAQPPDVMPGGWLDARGER
ncbi:hypothetical protein [Aestuariispira insulae]|uniref:Uncharacterized protein n=1 Tax=Aestuariispira insulae TaxID=1461337 RepID=A0A3D9HRP6_9PROT|nr:hypothetical protein [Aestuariispira insulae]RED52183.1 hypothetical protein DFP90_102201 [Aestuariispira insulae]